MAVKTNWAAGYEVNAADLNQNFKECGPFGAWASKSDNTVYQADTDGFVVAYANDKASGGPAIYTDSSNPPTTIRTKSHTPANADGGGMICPVKRGDYWKTVNCSTVFWMPVGTA